MARTRFARHRLKNGSHVWPLGAARHRTHIARIRADLVDAARRSRFWPRPGIGDSAWFAGRGAGREYMIRLAPGDLADPDKLGPMAEACGLTPEAFRSRHGYLTED